MDQLAVLLPTFVFSLSLTSTGIFCPYPTGQELNTLMSNSNPQYNENLLALTPSSVRQATDKITTVLRAQNKYSQPELKTTIAYVYDQYLKKAQALFDDKFNLALPSKYLPINVAEIKALRLQEDKQVAILKPSVGEIVARVNKLPFKLGSTTTPNGKVKDDFYGTLIALFGQSLADLVKLAYFSPEAHAMLFDRIGQYLRNTFDLTGEAVVALGLPNTHYSCGNPSGPEYALAKAPAGVDWPQIVAKEVPRFLF